MSEYEKKPLVIFTYAILILSTLLVFWQVRNYGFVYDDIDYVSENPHVLGGLSRDGIIWAFTTGHASNWHPLTWLSHMLDCHLFGRKPGSMHLTNLFLHLANVLLLFTIFKRMTGTLWPSAFVAAAFALHPMHVESVAWIAERKDVLSTFFLLLTLAAYVSYVKQPSIFRYIVTLVLFAVGLMAKPMLVTLPFLLLLLDYWPLGRFDRQPRRPDPTGDGRATLHRLVIEKNPFFVLAAISSVITFLIQHAGGSVANIAIIPLHSRLANAFLSYAKYVGKMFWPQNLAVYYPLDAISFAMAQVAMSILLLLVISILVIWFGHRRKYLPVGWFWFVGTLLPVIGLVQVGGQAYADRYTYIPYIGLFIMIAWGLSELLSKWPKRDIALGMVAAIALATMGTVTYRQVGNWKNGVTLFTHAIEVTQNNYLAHNNRGVDYNERGRLQEAIEDIKEAIRIKPDYTDAYYNLGIAYGNLTRWQEAIDAYKQAIRIKPDYAQAYNDLGVAYSSLGRGTEAMEAYTQAIRIKPDYADAYNNLGAAFNGLGRGTEAIEAYKQAIKIKPDNARAYNDLGVAYSSLGRGTEAMEAYTQAIRIKPDYADAYCNLGGTYNELGRLQEAIDAYKRAIKITPDYAKAHYNLGLAYSRLGRLQEAIEDFSSAIRIKPDYVEAYNNRGIVYANLGRMQEAIGDLKEAIRIKPDNVEAYNNLGVTYGGLGRGAEAAEAFEQVIRISPDYAEGRYNLAKILLQQGRRDEAADQYRTVLGLKGDWPGPMNDLAWLIAIDPEVKNRDTSEALRLASRACELSGYKNPAFLCTLAAAYASAGKFSEAIDTANKAMNLADAANQPQLKNTIQHHLSFYQQGKPYTKTAPKPLPDSNKP
jgi:protein O-mannosyl-transferase